VVFGGSPVMLKVTGSVTCNSVHQKQWSGTRYFQQPLKGAHQVGLALVLRMLTSPREGHLAQC